VSDEPISGVDYLPTVCAITGIEPPRDRVLDGTSFLSVLSGGSVIRATPLYWHFNRASSDPKVAMRIGDWKILATLDRNPGPPPNDLTEAEERSFKEAQLDKLSLYNLSRDVGETHDLAAEQPEKLAELKSRLEKKYLEVRAESPTWPPWKFTNAEGKRIEWPDYVKNRTRR
jgi:arylsulfatase A